MAITTTDLRTEVQTVDTPAETAVLQRCLDVSEAILDQYLLDQGVGTAEDLPPYGIPEAVHDQALLAMAVDEFNRRQAPNGILTQQFDNGDPAAPVRVSNDPMRAARALLTMWVTPGGFA